MKKRILYVLLSSLILCSCGHEQSASDKALTNAKKAYEIGQNYLSGDISAATDECGFSYPLIRSTICPIIHTLSIFVS